MKELAKNAIKKIAAIGLGTAMLGATVFGAVAADLKDYPQPFVNNGVFSGEIVVGNDAKVADVVGAIDIAASLQYAMKVAGTSGAVSSQGGVVTVDTGAAGVSGGFRIAATGDNLNMGEALQDVKASLDKTQLPDLLADGKVIKDGESSGTSYTQKIAFANAAEKISFGRSADSDSFGDVPGVFLATDSGLTYNLSVKFQGTIDATALDNSETIMIAGKEYTFDPTQSATGDLVLIGSQDSVILELGETKTIGGVDYTLLGANTKASGDATAILKVGSSQKTVKQGDSVTIGGNDVYIKSLYVTDIPTTSASMEVFVGSQKVKISQGTSDTVQINDKDVDGVKAAYTGINATAISGINFEVTRKDIDLSGAEKYLKEGQSFVDPLFGTFQINFAGQSVENTADARDLVEIERSGDVMSLSFVNEDKQVQKIDLYKYLATNNMTWADHLIYGGTQISEDSYFVIKEGSSNVAKVLKLDRVYKDNDVLKADFKAADGSTRTVSNNTQLGDITGNVVLDYSTKNATMGTAVVNLASGSITLDNKNTLTFVSAVNMTGGPNPAAAMNFTEYDTSGGALTEGLPANTFVVAVTPSTNSDHRLNVAVTSAVTLQADKDSKKSYAVSPIGTYVYADTDSSSVVDIYAAADPVEFNVFVAPTGAASTTATKEYKEGDVLAGVGTIKAITAGSVTGGSFNINKIALPLAKLDVDTSIGSANQIIVGGPAVNKLAAEAIGVSYPSYGLSSGMFEGAGEAVIKLVDQGTKVAIVVAGWEAADTQRATTVLANYGQYASKLTGKEVKITGTVASPVISLVVAEEPTNATQ